MIKTFFYYGIKKTVLDYSLQTILWFLSICLFKTYTTQNRFMYYHYLKFFTYSIEFI